MTYKTKQILYYARKSSWYLFLICLFLFISLYFIKDRYPPLKSIDPQVYTEPVQTKVELPSFIEKSEGHTYEISPLYKYDITGVVVTQHNSGSWLDYYHNRWGDAINVKDICVVWGDNVKTELYKDMKYRSGDFTCFYNANNYETYQRFNHSQISNNHLLTTNHKTREILRSVKKGDQIRLKGYLSSYTYDHGGSRGTSTSRDDRGEACETIYLTEAEIIKSSYPELDIMHTISKIGSILFLGLYTILFLLYPEGKPQKKLVHKKV